MSVPDDTPAHDLSAGERTAAILSYRIAGSQARVGGAFVPAQPDFPGSAFINRVIGERPDWPRSERELDLALDAVPPGTNFYVAVEAPAAERAGLWLEQRRLTPALGWMAFRLPPEATPDPATGLEIREARSTREFDAFARICMTAFELEPGSPDPFGNLDGWRIWLAFDGDEAVATGGLFEFGGHGYLSMDGTLPAARGKGAQSSLLAVRIGAARETGLTSLVVETGERREGLPDPSYRNILRSGFTEVGVTRHWSGRR